MQNTPVDAKALSRRISEAITQKSPFSFVRLGDGEGQLFDFSDQTTIEDLLYLQTHFGPSVTIKEIQEIKGRLLQAVASADVVGMRKDISEAPASGLKLSMDDEDFLAKFKEFFPLREREKQVINLKSAKRLFKLAQFYESSLSDKTIVSSWVQYDLQTAGFWDQFFSGLTEASIITSKPILKEKLENRFELDCDLISVSGKFSEARPDKSQLQANFRGVISHIEKTAKGRVFIVAAGMLGKYYCHVIKQSGGIALDLGALVDFWTGASSRGLINTDYGGAESNKYHAPSSLLLKTRLRIDPERQIPEGKQLYVHVGLSKTGTTGLQQSFLQNGQASGIQELGYLKAGRVEETGLNHDAFAMNFGMGHGGTVPAENRQKICTETYSEIEQSICTKFLISSELLSNRFPPMDVADEFGCFLRNTGAKIVVCLRNQLDWLIEWYYHAAQNNGTQQHIEAFYGNFNDVAQTLSYNYLSKIKYFENIVGRENLIVLSYDQEQDNFTRAFYQQLGLQDLAGVVPAVEDETATRIDAHILHLSVALKRHGGVSAADLQQHINRLLPRARDVPLRPHISKEFVNRLFKVCRPVNDAIYSTYGIDLNGPFRQAVTNHKFDAKNHMEENLRAIVKAIQ